MGVHGVGDDGQPDLPGGGRAELLGGGQHEQSDLCVAAPRPSCHRDAQVADMSMCIAASLNS